MEKIKIDDFLSYSYLSSLQFDENGIFFLLSKAKEDKSGYQTNLFTLKNNKAKQLTFDGNIISGKAHNGSFYFLSKREEGKKENHTTIYSLPLDGGEASPFLTIEGAISYFDFINDTTLFALSSVDTRTEHLSEEERAKENKSNLDFEEIEESAFYLNGVGFINGRRSRLVSISNGEKRNVFSDNFSTQAFSFSLDKTKLLALGEVRKEAKEQFTTELRIVDTATLSYSTILPIGQLSLTGAWFIDDKVVALGSDMKNYGINQNPDFYTIENNEAKLLAKWGESIYSSVGTDVKYGGGSPFSLDSSWLYFTTTLNNSSYVYRINKDGVIEKVTKEEGSVDSIATYNNELYYIGLREQKLQEIYTKDGAVTSLNTNCLLNKYVAVPEEIEFENDGTLFKGWVIKPIEYDENKKYPGILTIHGGPKTVYGTIFMHEMQYWASQGYFVFWTNPRGSDGRGDYFADIRGKYGTIDYSDLMKFTDTVLEAYPNIDKERIGETGGSYGGFMSNWILGHTDRFKAIATQRSIYNWISFYGTSDIGPYFAKDQCGAGLDNLEKMYFHSPMKAILGNANTPTLIIHSDKDYRCPVEQAYQLYNTLVDKGVKSRFVLFHNETHELSRSGKPSNRIKRLDEITKWMDSFLK